MIVSAELAQGAEAGPSIETMLRDPAVAYIQVHYAQHGCYAARIDRA